MSDEMITLFSPAGATGEQLRATLLALTEDDGIAFLGDPIADTNEVRFTVADDVVNDALGWLDDVALAEGLGLRHGQKTLRFGDEDINFTVRTRDDEDARIGVSRVGLEPTLKEMADDEDFIVITRFRLEDPADESLFIQARSFSAFDGWTLEYGAPEHYQTIVADVEQAITTLLRWMNGEDITDLDWSPAHNG